MLHILVCINISRDVLDLDASEDVPACHRIRTETEKKYMPAEDMQEQESPWESPEKVSEKLDILGLCQKRTSRQQEFLIKKILLLTILTIDDFFCKSYFALLSEAADSQSKVIHVNNRNFLLKNSCFLTSMILIIEKHSPRVPSESQRQSPAWKKPLCPSTDPPAHPALLDQALHAHR